MAYDKDHKESEWVKMVTQRAYQIHHIWMSIKIPHDDFVEVKTEI